MPVYPEPFLRALSLTLEIEGLYSNRDIYADPGGETFMGVSRVYHPEMWKDGRPSVAAVVDFYHREYWRRHRLSDVPWPASLVVFDFSVNSGGAVRVIQKKLKVDADGVVGPRTIAALADATGSEEAMARLNVARIRYLMDRPNWEQNANGWLYRVLRIQGEVARCWARTEPFLPRSEPS